MYIYIYICMCIYIYINIRMSIRIYRLDVGGLREGSHRQIVWNENTAAVLNNLLGQIAIQLPVPLQPETKSPAKRRQVLARRGKGYEANFICKAEIQRDSVVIPWQAGIATTAMLMDALDLSSISKAPKRYTSRGSQCQDRRLIPAGFRV